MLLRLFKPLSTKNFSTKTKTNNVMATEIKSKLPTFYLSHGGGPCFFMDDTDGPFAQMGSKSDARKWYESFQKFVPEQPKNILVISAHW